MRELPSEKKDHLKDYLPEPDSISLHREDENWQEHLLDLWDKRKREELKGILQELHPSDIAFLLERLDLDKGYSILGELSLEIKGDVLAELPDILREEYVRRMGMVEIASVVEGQASGKAVHVLEGLENETIQQILSYVPPLRRIRIIEHLNYPENTAGSIMTKEMVTVQTEQTVQKAISILRKTREKEKIHNIFVANKEGCYQGHIPLAKLVLSKPETKAKRIMENELIPIPVDTDQEEVARIFTRYDFITAPVISSSGVLLGRITADDILEVVQEEASEDILSMAGVSEEETLSSPFIRSSFKRTGWLLLNLISAFLSSVVIQSFGHTIEKSIVLAAIMPIVASIGGSAGGQSMALAVRRIALGNLRRGQTRRRLRKEFAVGLLNGIVVGGIAALIVYFVTKDLLLSSILLMALCGNMIFATSAGTLIPQLLYYLRIDPAVGSVILITSCTDIFGFFLFLSLAFLLL